MASAGRFRLGPWYDEKIQSREWKSTVATKHLGMGSDLLCTVHLGYRFFATGMVVEDKMAWWGVVLDEAIPRPPLGAPIGFGYGRVRIGGALRYWRAMDRLFTSPRA